MKSISFLTSLQGSRKCISAIFLDFPWLQWTNKELFYGVTSVLLSQFVSASVLRRNTKINQTILESISKTTQRSSKKYPSMSGINKAGWHMFSENLFPRPTSQHLQQHLSHHVQRKNGGARVAEAEVTVQRKPSSAQIGLLRTTQSRSVNWAFIHEPTQHQHRASGDRFQLGGRVGGEVEEGGRLKLFVHRLWSAAELQEEE